MNETETVMFLLNVQKTLARTEYSPPPCRSRKMGDKSVSKIDYVSEKTHQYIIEICFYLECSNYKSNYQVYSLSKQPVVDLPLF